MASHLDSFKTRMTLLTASGDVTIFSLAGLTDSGAGDVSRFPYSIKVLLEAVLRTENGKEVTAEDVKKLVDYDPSSPAKVDIPYTPSRVLMQDFTGVPALVDLAALRSAMARLGADPSRINPALPVDLIIDHSVQVDAYGSHDALQINADLEFSRNRERYEFLHWGQRAFDNFTVVPPASGICHQVNLESLGKVVGTKVEEGQTFAFPDTLVGTDSHTTMINGLGILGWGVGGIEAEAAMLGQPIYMLMPEVVGFRLVGKPQENTTATDIVLAVTQILRSHGVVGKFVEFFGTGLSAMTLTDRATIANMAPEYGATCGFFPVDDETLRYMRYTGRSEAQIDLVERYCKHQGLFRSKDTPDPEFATVLELDLSTVTASLSGPKRPQDRILLEKMKSQWATDLRASSKDGGLAVPEEKVGTSAPVEFPDGSTGELKNGDVVIAAITSCTNTSNPSVLIGAAVLAKKAVEAGLSVKPHVKTSLAPGSRVVTSYLTESGLMPYLEKLGFHLVGYGCTTCIGNSGPIPEHLAGPINDGGLAVASVLSGNRNFEGRISPHIKANYLASPPLVVAYALAGTVDKDISTEPLGDGTNGPVYLKDIWPTPAEIRESLPLSEDPTVFNDVYDTILTSNETWNAIPSIDDAVYPWNETSTYIQEPPFFVGMGEKPEPIGPIQNARVLVKVGASVTTDHISPAGAIPADGPAGKFLVEHGIAPVDFNSFGSRRGNDRVMTRGTFANVRVRNEIAPGTEGGWSTHLPTGEQMSIYEASLKYIADGTPGIVLAGADYGMGSSRDWAAKGTFLLGVKAVIAESFERIHRSNLVGMGVLPLQFKAGQSAETLGLTGKETFSIAVDDAVSPGQAISVNVLGEDGASLSFETVCRLDTPIEVDYYRNGGILHTVLRNILAGS
jgi:aconitate hydratase A / 2-methylisocitrate dehydratase